MEVEVFGIPPEALERIQALRNVDLLSVENRDQKQALLIHSRDVSETVAPVVSTLQEMGLRVGSVAIREPTLEDAYVRLVGGQS